MAGKLNQILFRRQAEPRENAFTLLVPDGWLIEGGIFRINPTTGSVQSTSSKIDMIIKRDTGGSAMVRFLPSANYFDPRRSTIGMMGMMPVGSNYQGMLVFPVVPPQQFLAQIVFAYVHQGQTPNPVEMVEQRDRPDMVEAFLRRGNQALPPGFAHAAAEVTFRYSEGTAQYRERALGLVQDMGQLAGGMWGNHDTWCYRAPDDEFEQWAPVFQAIQASIIMNPAWIQEELRAQQIASGMLLERQQAEQYRARRALDFQRDMQQTMQEMVDHRRRTNDEIRNDQYLLMTNQEEYRNPYTGDVDLGSNQWSHRWVTADGREFYTDNESDNPNHDDYLHQWEWKPSQVRPRFPE